MSAGGVKIRRLALTELPSVIAIERRAFLTPWSVTMFVLELSKPSSICLAAERDGRLVGYVICARYADVWHIMNVATDPDVRRQGVARALIEGLLNQAGHDCAYTLEVRASNLPAIALYESFGFRSAGLRPRYYADNGEDALIMWLTLPQTTQVGT